MRAMRALLRDPDDTAQVFRIVEALSGRTGERTFARFRQSPTGVRILQERRNLLKTLEDRAALLALPPGSLGRSYAEFVAREQISADGLVDASRARSGVADPDRQLVFDRLRDMHDLWHVVTGYGRDLVGEAALLAFSFAQTRNPGIGFIVAVALGKARGNREFRRLLIGGWRRGRRAEWLPAADWEALLPLPLEEVRARLGVLAAPRYEGVRSAGAPALAA
jgi:ubiquinone biosynthesis protein COQ4